MSDSEEGLLSLGRGRKPQEMIVDSDTVVQVNPLLMAGLSDFHHHYRMEDGSVKLFNWKWAAPWPNLAKLFLTAVHNMSEPGGPIGSHKAAQGYQSWAKPLFIWLSEADPKKQVGQAQPFSPEIFNKFRAHLDGRVNAGKLASKTAYQYKGASIRIVRQILSENPAAFGTPWTDEALILDRFTDDYGNRQPYSAAEAIRIVAAVSALLGEAVTDPDVGEDTRLVELAIYTGIGLKLGIETECIDRLRVGSIKPTQDGKRLQIRYEKRRSPSRPKRVKAISSEEWEDLLEEVGTFKTAGGMLSYLVGRRRKRGAEDEDSLWSRPYVALDFLWFTDMLDQRGLRGDDGSLLKIDRTKFRVTHKTARLLKSGGNISVSADDHSKNVGVKHYLENERLLPYYEQAIEDAALEALAYALEKPKVIPVPLDASPGAVEKAASQVGLPPAEVQRALDGTTDAWLVSCRDYMNSPFDPAGSPCSKSFWGCLSCKNALVTRRTLPRMLRFLSHIAEQRAMMSEPDWEAKFGKAYRQIVGDILPQFPADALAVARAVAEGLAGQLHIPPELMN